MNEYNIGIIDEDHDEILDIKRTIVINKPENVDEDSICFIDYSLPAEADTLSTEVTNEVIRDIINGKVHLLIVDYRIIVASTYVEGTEIFKRLSNVVSKFPVIILTNVPEGCYSKPFVDADKVYAKRAFFKIEESYSQEKTKNIFRNIENYKTQRAALSATLTEQLLELEQKGYKPEVYQKVIELENTLDDYYPQDQTTIEKELDLSELRDAVELLREANRLLGDENENT